MFSKRPPYSAYARHYDQIGQRRFGERVAALVLDLLASEGRSIQSALDVACGTGAATHVFAERGLRAVGLDLSAEMLDIARERELPQGAQVTWLLGDMRAFELGERFDLCSCFYDAVNYLETLTDVAAFARSCRRTLHPGGVLAFDINTRRKLADLWSDMTLLAADNQDLFLVYRSWYDEKRGNSPLIMTGFERRADGAWYRFDEEHVETAFAIDDLREVLIAEGFENVRVLDLGDSPPKSIRPGTEDSFRVLFMAENRKDEGTTP